MFEFKLEADIPLLTVIRTGAWSLSTVVSYEAALRRELAKLHAAGGPTAFIVDVRSSGAQPKDVADALRAMVARLGPLHADRTAVVASSGIAKLQAKRVADPNAQVFTSLVLARDWVKTAANPASAPNAVHDQPSVTEVEGAIVHLRGPSDVDVRLTPAAAQETGKRLSEAAKQASSCFLSGNGTH